MARTKIEQIDKQRYLAAESAAAKELQLFLDQEPPGVMRQELALLRYQISQAVANGQGVLCKDLCQCLAAMIRVATSQRILMGELVPVADVRQYGQQIADLLATVAQRHLRAGQWEALCDDFQEEWQEAESQLIEQARKAAPKRIKLQ